MNQASTLSGRKILFRQRYSRSLLKVGMESKENVNVAPLYMECDIRKITHFPPTHTLLTSIAHCSRSVFLPSRVRVMNIVKKMTCIRVRVGGHLMFISTMKNSPVASNNDDGQGSLICPSPFILLGNIHLFNALILQLN